MGRKKTGAIKSKKKVYDGKTFQSNLEWYCYKELKNAGLKFGYESEVIELLQGFYYEGTYLKSTGTKRDLIDKTGKKELPITYKPDFVSHEHEFYIETKGYVPSQHTFTVRWKLFLKWLVDNDRGHYSVFLPKNQKQIDEIIKRIKGK
jgi:hypothetical protein